MAPPAAIIECTILICFAIFNCIVPDRVDELTAMSQVESNEHDNLNSNNDSNTGSSNNSNNNNTNSDSDSTISATVQCNPNAVSEKFAAQTDDRSLIITTLPESESTNAYAVDNDINRNCSGNSIDASCDIIVSVPTTDALHISDTSTTTTTTTATVHEENMIPTLDNLADNEIEVTASICPSTTTADAVHSAAVLPHDLVHCIASSQKHSTDTDIHTIFVNYAQINQSNEKLEDQTASIHVSLDENSSNSDAIDIINNNSNNDAKSLPQCKSNQQKFAGNSDNFVKNKQTNDFNSNNSDAQQQQQNQPQINQIKVADKDVNRTSTFDTHEQNTQQPMELPANEPESDSSPVVVLQKPNEKQQMYRVESPEPNKKNISNITAATSIKKSRSLNDSTELGIQELSDGGSSAFENDNTPLVSEVESEPEPELSDANHKPKIQYPNRLISVETFPLDYQCETNVELCSEIEADLRNCIAEQLIDKEPSQPSSSSSPTMAKRQKKAPQLPPLLPSSFFNSQLLNPINNYLHAISEENSDASDVEQPKINETNNSDNGNDTVNSPKPKKADAIYPKSNFDFSRIGRHTNLVAPSTEAIREEPQRILVDVKLIETDKTSAESQSPWKTSTADEQRHAEVIYLDSSSSNTSSSDIESTSGVEGDIEDLCSESDVRIETPVIGSNSFSAFTPIAKKPSPDHLSELNGNLTSDTISMELNIDNNNGMLPNLLNTEPKPLQIEINKCPNPTSIDLSFKPINDDQCSLRSLLQNIAATSTESLTENETHTFSISDNTENNQIPGLSWGDKTTDIEKQTIQNNQIINVQASKTETETDTQTDHENAHKKCNILIEQTTKTHAKQSNDTKHDQLLSPKFKIGELCSNTMFLGGVKLDEHNSLVSNVNNQEINRQDSSSSSSHSSQTNSTSHSQCTARYLAQHTSPDDSIEFTDVKTLRQLSIERLVSLPYGDVVLDELAKASQELTDPTMPYPPPKLPHIEDLEIRTQPRPPPRSSQSTVKFLSNYKLKSPSPPPVPHRPWLGLPTHENPNVLVCLSPAQRDLYSGKSAPDHLLDLHNKFVGRRGYHEYTDDEVMAINFRESHASGPTPPSSLPSQRMTECDKSHAKSKDDNRLLALIREINQLTTSSTDAENAKEPILPTYTATDTQSPADTHQSDHASTLKMSRSTGTNYFNNKRFSNYFDELNRLHPIIEETPKVYRNVETTNYQSRKRIENGQVVYDYSDSSHEKSSNIQQQQQHQPNASKTNENNNNNDNRQNAPNKNPCDVNIDKAQRSDEADAAAATAFSANPIENRYCKFAENKNSQTNDDSVHRTSVKSTADESHKKSTNEQTEQIASSASAAATAATASTDADSNRSRSFFREFDFVPKIFSNFFRANKSDDDDTKCANTVITNESSETTVQTSSTTTERTIQTSNHSEFGENRMSISPLPLRHSERYSSTQSLYDLFSEDREAPIFRRSPSISNLGVKSVNRGRISPNPIRAPRLTESPPKPDESGTQHRHYDWTATTNQNRNFVNRQSMIDQTPITQYVSYNPRRMSLPKQIADNQLAYILEKERQITNEFDKLEKDRARLLAELEEMQVNQSFEDFFKENKKRNSMLPTVGPLTEEEQIKKRMQDEWLSKVAEREERRLQKIIKVTHSQSEVTPSFMSQTNRGLGDEFLDRVKERRSKLQIPSDSDWDSGAESQPIKRNQPSPKIDPTVKVLDDGRETDIKTLPQHLKEFAEFTTKTESSSKSEHSSTNQTSTLTTESKEIIHKIERCNNEDGESSKAVQYNLCA